MPKDPWLRRKILDRTDPPILVGVPGSFMGIEVPYMPKPGRLQVVAPYACSGYVDLGALRGMRWVCRIREREAA